MARVLWLSLAAIAFVAMALVHADRVNVDVHRHDQDSYLAFALREKTEHFQALGTRRQMPVYPMLQALFMDPEATEEARFARAKRVNVALSVLLSIAFVLALRKLLPPREATNTALVTVFFVFAFRAPYVQVEVLSYAVIFGLFLLLCVFYKRPSLLLALAVGATTAFGWLVKATALLGLYAFLVVLAAREIVRLVRTKDARTVAKNAALGATAWGVFFALVYPYAKTSKALYGSYLYDMNTRYVFWCDSWQEFQQLFLRHGPHEGWRDLPPDELPSMHRWFATHGIGDLFAREIRGLAEVLGNLVIGHGYAIPSLLLLVLGAAILRQSPAVRARLFRRDLGALAWFVVPYFAIHLLTLGFYGPIGANARFSLGLFLPATYALMRAFAPDPDARVQVGGFAIDWRGAQTLLTILLVVEIATYWPVAMATTYAGG
jgi:hypothetical protein